jgi:hypothetical protein
MMLSVVPSIADDIRWPESISLAESLKAYGQEVIERPIWGEMYKDTDEPKGRHFL